ncbi:ATP-dependent DNA helicase [Paenibacillus rigui]|uniref:ATP-dependent DNA helicase n=1 Tax=Paenibacillus rigui TaxID=554312 RepID=UPI0015C649BB|nr:ATP-dependent DNA helicase [Paenibacillus rigui]
MSNSVPISVRSLVEYAFRSGSIDSGFRTSAALTEGTKAHQKVQRQYGEHDQKEVYLSAELAWDGLVFAIDGRCDGLLQHEGLVTIDEIKSTSGDIARIEEDTYPVHWAQAKCYAYMYAKEHGVDRMGLQLTYVEVESEAQKRFKAEASFEELERFVLDVVRRFAPYARMRKEHEQARDCSIRELAFPFDNYREGQRKLAGAVYKSIAKGNMLFAKAPTGIGKTMSTLFPAVKAIGEGVLQRLFYLTAKTITRTAAEEACAIMQARGLKLHAITITAKEKVCFQDEVRCTKEHCEYADGYYDRINEALLDIQTQETLMTRGVIEHYARKHCVCPFEFSLDAAYAADAVICDYNYIFDPRASLKRQFEEQKRHTALLVDEAHNLVDRAREMYSSSLGKADFLAVQREFKAVNPDIHAAAKAVNAYFIALRKQLGERRYHVDSSLPEALVALLEAFVKAAERELSGGGGTNGLLELYFSAQAFLRTAKLYDERYVTCVESDRSGVRLKLFCLDPSHLLGHMGKGFRSQVLFSATLSPLSYYMDMLGGDAESYTVTVPSPFSKDQLEVTLQPLSTRYADRERSRVPIAEAIRQMIDGRTGNVLVFFPSYEYMNNVVEKFVEQSPEVKIQVQQTVMSEAEREQFLAAFDAGNEDTLVGFAVMGGIFSEGIDLVGERLNGVVVVGVGLPQVGLERNLIKEYMDRTGKNGFDYAYVYPGMNKVLQAGGRLIRSETDRGRLLLIDDRYLQRQYQRLLPDEWKDYTLLRPAAVQQQMEQ